MKPYEPMLRFLKKGTVMVAILLISSGLFCFILNRLHIGQFDLGWSITAFIAGCLILSFDGLNFYLEERKKARQSKR
jgi:membrane-bound ClpP family serine protease